MNAQKALVPLFILALLAAGCQDPASVPKSDAKSLLSFKFEASKNPGLLAADYAALRLDGSDIWEVGPLPAGTSVSSLVATFELSPLAAAAVGGLAQVSGATANSFASDLSFVVKAEDGSAATYKISVRVAASSSSKDITAFGIAAGGTTVGASISGTDIALTLPFGTALGSLVATFTLSDAGATAAVDGLAQVSGATTNDFSSPIQYLVTAADGSDKTYTVTVALAEPSGSALFISEVFVSATNTNRYIELCNPGTAAIDLSAYGLRNYLDGSSTPTAAYALTGSLGAGKSVVYVATLYSTAVLDSVYALPTTAGDPAGWKVSVTWSAVPVNINGNDCIELVKGAESMDFFGAMGSSASLSANMKFVRKPGKLGRTDQGWSLEDWMYIAVKNSADFPSEDDTAGSHATSFAGSSISDFALGAVRGSIAGTDITLIAPPGTAIASLSAVLPYFVTSAETVAYGQTALSCGSTPLDISGLAGVSVSSPIVGTEYDALLRVSTSADSFSTDYSLKFIIPTPQAYTAVNYDFGGGIQAAFDAIGASNGYQTLNIDGSGVLNNWGTVDKSYGTGGDGVIVGQAAAVGDSVIYLGPVDDSRNPIRPGATVDILTSPRQTRTIASVEQAGGKTTALHLAGALTTAVLQNTNLSVTAIQGATSASAAAGATSIGISIADSLYNVAVGDRFTIFGEFGGWHTVAATTKEGGLTTGLSFAPALSNSVSASATVYFAINPAQNPGVDTALTGLVTAVPSADRIFIQDKDAAICVSYLGAFQNVKLGDKIRISNCRAGQNNLDYVEVTTFGAPVAPSTTQLPPSIETLSTGNAIYFEDVTKIGGIADQKTKRYHGRITTSAAAGWPYGGIFDSGNSDYRFRAADAGSAAIFTTDKYPLAMDFYGVVDLSLSGSQLLLITADQVRSSP
jgi:hypothetical protein